MADHDDIFDASRALVQRTVVKERRRARIWKLLAAAVFLTDLGFSTATLVFVVESHQQTIDQIKQGPKEIAQAESQVLCPVLRSVAAVHPTADRVALINKYCVTKKEIR